MKASDKIDPHVAAIHGDYKYIKVCLESLIATVNTQKQTLDSFSTFAWATFDGEGSYDLMLYEGNENYKEEYIQRNGDEYKDWVVELYMKDSK